ncbi:hypothetical protein IC582_009573 [Cucumis melo]|uniref:Uncharacterized protein LOC103486338 n=2 Tax=Cucumis melo TaxID=3656 RepID=A0A1S3B6J4_CUCME|nr:uncharacterized protein LOC103486338 [Cucumis melo]KAA0044137.1 PAR1 protein [Cucumis melo var. makuwa]TYK25000.1 PAR1 protein [Cucumis melo var. makuwa]
MAIPNKLAFLLFISSLFVSAAFGEIVCEELSVDVCAFSIASSGKRCLLETSETKEGKFEYQCRTSEVMVEWMADYIETDQCINACGLDRNSVGIASDALLEPQFTAKLCSPSCYQKCPNIVDLYFNMAAGEGVFLPDLCEKQRTNPHRAMAELLSSGIAAAPMSSAEINAVFPAAEAPAPM